MRGVDPEKPDGFLFVEGGRAYRKSRGDLTCARHAGTAQPKLTPPRAIVQAVGPDE
jgi:hypothetical protein